MPKAAEQVAEERRVVSLMLYGSFLRNDFKRLRQCTVKGESACGGRKRLPMGESATTGKCVRVAALPPNKSYACCVLRLILPNFCTYISKSM